MRTTGVFGAAARRARRFRLLNSLSGSEGGRAAFGVAVIAFTTRDHHGGAHGGGYHPTLANYIGVGVVVAGYIAWWLFKRRLRGGS